MVCGHQPIIDRPQKCTVYGYQPITYGPRWYNVHSRFCQELFQASELLLFDYIPEYLSSALGNVVLSTIQRLALVPISKLLFLILVKNNQNGPHPHEYLQKVIIVDPLWKGYKQEESIRKRGQTIEGNELENRERTSEEAP